MTKTTFVKNIKHLKNLIGRRESVINSMMKIGFRPESEIFNIIYEYENFLIEKIAIEVGDVHAESWCEWFIVENNFGENGFEAYIDDKKYIIKTVEELYDFIHEVYEI